MFIITMSICIISCLLCSLVDISQSRLDFAKQMGADHIILAETKDGQVMAEKVKAAFGGHMPDISMDCSGAESAIQLAIYVSEKGGVSGKTSTTHILYLSF